MLTSKDYSRKYYITHREARLLANSLYNKEHRIERNARLRAWCKANPEKRFLRYQRARLKKYGLTIEKYTQLLMEQDFKCAACGGEMEVSTSSNRIRNGKSVVVDHDHITGAVRGLVHNDCNRAIGLLQDNPDVIKKVADYLRIAKENNKKE